MAWAAGDALALRFDSRVLYNLGNLLSNYLKSKLNNMLVDAGGSLVLGAAYATLALPQKLIRSFFFFFFSHILEFRYFCIYWISYASYSCIRPRSFRALWSSREEVTVGNGRRRIPVSVGAVFGALPPPATK